jgi:hypothetical protein
MEFAVCAGTALLRSAIVAIVALLVDVAVAVVAAAQY